MEWMTLNEPDGGSSSAKFLGPSEEPARINEYDLSLGFGPYLWPAEVAPRLTERAHATPTRWRNISGASLTRRRKSSGFGPSRRSPRRAAADASRAPAPPSRSRRAACYRGAARAV